MNDEEFEEFGGQMQRAIPGESLNNDPDNPAPFEGPPTYTDLDSASLYLWTRITSPEVYIPAMEMISNDAPIMDMTQAILLAEFQNGAWNPDLMLMLVEPLTYMFIALAERLDLEPVIYLGEMEDEDTEEQILGVSFQEEKINEMKKAAQSGKVPAGIISAEMEASLPSLPEVEIPEEQPVQAQPSLMAAPQQGI
jgi:hypothetical protein